MRNNNRKSLQQIAKELKVSATTVSFVLNGKAKEYRVSETLEKRIIKYVKETGYQPNAIARSLRTGKSHTIALIIENISNPFFATIANLIEDKAYRNGYKIIYSSTNNDTAKALELIQMFEDRGVDGYIIAATPGLEKTLKALIKRDRPVVLFDRIVDGVESDTVIIRNHESTFKATNQLIRRGFRRIVLISIPASMPQIKERMSGYSEAMRQKGMRPLIKQVAYSLGQTEQVTEIQKILKETKADAVVFATNYLGVAGLEAIRNLGIKIPDDLAVLSFDDHILFQLSTPSISVIAQPVELIADHVIDLLLSRLSREKPRHRTKSVKLETRLIIRDSC